MRMVADFKTILKICKETFSSWVASKTPRLGAALAYYTVFAIVPLFLIALGIAGVCFGEKTARDQLFGQLRGLLGAQSAAAVEALVTSASTKRTTGIWATGLATVTLLLAVTAVFVELQDALNTIWKVERVGGGFRHFLKDRLLSFGMVVGIGFLLLVSLVVSAALAGIDKFVPGASSTQHLVWNVMNFTISLAVITVLFAMILKVLPDVKISWRDVWVGGLITALLFNFGKFLLGFYLGKSTVASAYGAAGSLVVILVWVYYSAQILFLGAQFTRVYADHYGARLEPVHGARIIPEVKQKPAR